MRVLIWQVIDWIANKSDKTIISRREAMISAIECAGHQSKESGKCAEWSRGADAQTIAVLSGTNGVLFHTLLVASKYSDAKCVELLRTGTVTLSVDEQISIAYCASCRYRNGW